MKFKATSRGRDLRTYSLDSLDVFLLSRLEDELTPEELADVSVCDREETTRRVRVLASYGLVEMTGSSPVNPALAMTANDNGADSPTTRTLPPPDDFCAETLFDESEPAEEAPDAHADLKNTLPFLRPKRPT